MLLLFWEEEGGEGRFVSSLQDHSGGFGDPVGVGADTGEAVGQAVLAAQRRDERGDSDGGVTAVGFDEAQRATAVALSVQKGQKKTNDEGQVRFRSLDYNEDMDGNRFVQ